MSAGRLAEEPRSHSMQTLARGAGNMKFLQVILEEL
jgi:hypothetical protein